MYCVVLDCKSVWDPKSNIKFHSFPKDDKRRRIWLSNISLKGKFYESAKICSLHFKEEDYDCDRPGHLLKSAYPIYLQGLCDYGSEQACSTTQTSTDNKIIEPASIIKTEQKGHAECHLKENILPSPNPQPGSSQQVVQMDENESPPAKRRCLKDFNVQVKMKTPREIALEKSKKALQQKVVRQEHKISDMKSLINVVRNYTSQTEIENILQGNFANICKAFNYKAAKSKGVSYSDEVKAFALTVHFYSPRAYEFLRTVISLPHTTTLWRCISSFNCDVGFLNEVLQYLKHQLPEKPHLKNVALIFDSMSLKKDISYDPKLGKLFGYVDLGSIPVSEPEQLASEVLIFQIVSYTNYLKCPIGYFFTPNSLSGELLGQLIYSALILLMEIGITVRSLTCDGAKCNIKALESLGCCLSEEELKPYFRHPNGVSNVCCLLDAAHMLKLARNVLSDFGLNTPDGEVSFKFIKNLHDIQEKEGLKLSNKITGGHINYKNKKMNVRMAAQTLSSSVADAIDFLRYSGDSNFEGSEATSNFIRIIDRLFDNMNSRSPYGKGFKSPLSNHNKEVWQSFFKEAADYIMKIKIGDTPILRHGRKTFALGFLMNLISLKMLFYDLTSLPENPLKYFLTFKCSQDNLEIFFSLIRSRGRTQDNPSPLEVRYILRKLLFRNSVQPSINANCVDDAFNSNHVIDFRNKTRSLIENPNNEEEDVDELVNNMVSHRFVFTCINDNE